VSRSVSEETFDKEVLQRSHELPVVVDFWAEWCGPCKALSPALEAAEKARDGKVLLAKVDVDANQRLSALFRVQGIPAVKAFRDGKIVDEFTGALPPARVEAFFDKLVPSRAEELFDAGDELSLREAAELEPSRADIAVALAKARIARGAQDEAIEAITDHEADFGAAGIAARLGQAGVGAEAFAALDRGDLSEAVEGLIDELRGLAAREAGGDAVARREWATGGDGTDPGLEPGELRDLLRRAIVGILDDLDPADPTARAYRRKLAAALG
jgi:putative thioredoxin